MKPSHWVVFALTALIFGASIGNLTWSRQRALERELDCTRELRQELWRNRIMHRVVDSTIKDKSLKWVYMRRAMSREEP